MKKRLVVALGGNAIQRPDEKGTVGEQLRNIGATCRQLADIAAQGYQLVVTHGNGPQVGNVLIQNEEARVLVPPMPLDVCVAQTQGQLGYLIQGELAQALAERGLRVPVATVVTRVLVDPADPAFADPSKPVGPFYTEQRARRLMETHGYAMKEDANRGWRRVVPSPEPLGIVEIDAINRLLDAGSVVIACGGGGIPVQAIAGGYAGVEAVIDKDLAGEQLGRATGAGGLMILTDVDQVRLFFGTPRETPLARMTTAEARRYIKEGHFRPGSMLPKVEAALRFAASTGGLAVITSLQQASLALAGKAGTRIIKED